ncbi:MAG: RecX family transcriptional regulator [Mogibacterium sp.]|nr:RecX family transcriptional regulator [Mogibacterium sp.]
MSADKKTALEIASAYLANRMRTSDEVRKRLEEKGFREDESESAIEELEGLGYLDDYEYALRYFEYNREKKRGSERAARELAEKGVDEGIIKNAREDFLYENKVDEYQDALEIALRDIEGKSIDERMRAKVARRLEGKGFASGDIIKVLEVIKK